MKIAFIVQRYGREILGGAETLARQIAERLARRHEIEVLTTTARDYVTWRNEYTAGEEKLRGVKIRRFPVEGERELEEFNRYSDWIYSNQHTRQDELKWLEMQGPVVPELIDYLRAEHGRFELLLFFTYLYYPTYYGLRIAPGKSALLPTAHDEPPLKLEIYKDLFGLPSGLIFNTEAEELLVLERFGVYKKMRETIGIGMELLDAPDAPGFRRRNKLPGRYLLYAGRIDAGKGCDELLRFFRFYKEERPEMANLHLVLIGKQSMRLPEARDIRYLGFLDEADKFAAMAAATAVVVPSRMESLSIVALEAFAVGTPVIVNSGSKVLVDHSRTANAGLYYSDYDEFEAILDLLLRDKNLARGMGKLGQKYIKENFGWEKLLNRYEVTLRSLSRPPRPVARAKPAGKPQQERPRQERPKTAEGSKKPTKSGKEETPSKVMETEAKATEVVEPVAAGNGTRAPKEVPEARPTAEPEREREEPKRRVLPGEVIRRSRRGSPAKGPRDSSSARDSKSKVRGERDKKGRQEAKSKGGASASAETKDKTTATADKSAGAETKDKTTATADKSAGAETKDKTTATADKSAGAETREKTMASASAEPTGKPLATADKTADKTSDGQRAKPVSPKAPATSASAESTNKPIAAAETRDKPTASASAQTSNKPMASADKPAEQTSDKIAEQTVDKPAAVESTTKPAASASAEPIDKPLATADKMADKPADGQRDKPVSSKAAIAATVDTAPASAEVATDDPAPVSDKAVSTKTPATSTSAETKDKTMASADRSASADVDRSSPTVDRSVSAEDPGKIVDKPADQTSDETDKSASVEIPEGDAKAIANGDKNAGGNEHSEKEPTEQDREP